MVTSSGAETLPFLASFQLPASLAFFVIYGRIIDLHLPRSTTFALVVAPLLAAYAGFALFLYPAADLLHPHGFTAALAPSLARRPARPVEGESVHLCPQLSHCVSSAEGLRLGFGRAAVRYSSLGSL